MIKYTSNQIKNQLRNENISTFPELQRRKADQHRKTFLFMSEWSQDLLSRELQLQKAQSKLKQLISSINGQQNNSSLMNQDIDIDSVKPNNSSSMISFQQPQQQKRSRKTISYNQQKEPPSLKPFNLQQMIQTQLIEKIQNVYTKQILMYESNKKTTIGGGVGGGFIKRNHHNQSEDDSLMEQSGLAGGSMMMESSGSSGLGIEFGIGCESGQQKQPQPQPQCNNNLNSMSCQQNFEDYFNAFTCYTANGKQCQQIQQQSQHQGQDLIQPISFSHDLQQQSQIMQNDDDEYQYQNSDHVDNYSSSQFPQNSMYTTELK